MSDMTNSMKPSAATRRRHAEFTRIFDCAIHKAQEENRRLGIPNVYSRNGKLYYEMPDGRITDVNPYDNGTADAASLRSPGPSLARTGCRIPSRSWPIRLARLP